MIKILLILSLAFAATALFVPANDSRIYYTEQNWYKDPTGYLETSNSGAYLKFAFTGSSISLLVDDSALKGVSMTLAWSVDGGPEQSLVLPVTSTTISLGSNLNKAVNHTVYMFIRNYASGDRWHNPDTRLRIKSLIIDDGATLYAPTLAPKRLLAYWDSIGEGIAVNGRQSWDKAHDAHVTFAFSLALGLNAELSLVAFSGQGYTKGGAGSSPQLWSSSGASTESAWNWLAGNHPRTFETCPDYIINGHGTNDYQSDVNVVYTNSLGWIRDMRKACPKSRIFLTVPFGRYVEDVLVKVMNTYQSATPDPLAHLIQMGDQASPGLQRGGDSFEAVDGLHPWAWKSSQLGALLAAKITPLLSNNYRIEL